MGKIRFWGLLVVLIVFSILVKKIDYPNDGIFSALLFDLTSFKSSLTLLPTASRLQTGPSNNRSIKTIYGNRDLDQEPCLPAVTPTVDVKCPTCKSCDVRNNNSDCPKGSACDRGCGPPVVRGCSSAKTDECARMDQGCRNGICLSYKGSCVPLSDLERRNCPICLSSSATIATPRGEIKVTNLKQGMLVWSQDKNGKKITVPVVKLAKTFTGNNHRVVHLVLKDGRQLDVSANHPTADGRLVGQLEAGEIYDNSVVVSARLIPYRDAYTYDLLPRSVTGYYWANNILMGSTLKY